MEDPATWNETKRTIHEAILEHEECMRLQMMCGPSLETRIYSKLSAKGLLVKEEGPSKKVSGTYSHALPTLTLNEDGTFCWVSEGEKVVGTYVVKGNKIHATALGSTVVFKLRKNGTLIDSEGDRWSK